MELYCQKIILTLMPEPKLDTMLRMMKSSWVIHLFAIMHAVVLLICQWGGVNDELTLTILTMTMTVIICLKKGMPIDIIAVMVIVVNVAGFVLGTMGANMISRLVDKEVAARLISTVFTTELLGWTLILLARLTYKFGAVKAESSRSDSRLRWVLIIAGVIFILRIGSDMLFSTPLYAGKSVMTYAWKIISNSPTLITYLCLTIICVRRLHRFVPEKHNSLAWLVYLLAIGSISAVSAWCFSYAQGHAFTLRVDANLFLRYFVASLLVETTLCCIVILVNNIFTIRRDMQHERERAAHAQYRYVTLKQQVNPHFLFNSLNTLDSLVCEQRTAQASDYIHKMAHMYRYMLRCEEEVLVPLHEEINFIREYVSLQSVRFPKGFDIKYDIPEEAMKRMVVPCAVYLLVENAFKHNAISETNPLHIVISVNDDHLTIENNVLPKFTRPTSTGVGQKYIREHYRSLSTKDMLIHYDEKHYRVIIPLL